MKKLLGFLALPLLLLTACGGEEGGTSGEFTLVWSDEFEGTTLDSAKWDVMTGNGAEYGNPGWGNNEAEWYQEDNISLKDGNLVITAKKERIEGEGKTFEYTSARIRTYQKAYWTYGRFEARMALPNVDGMWPAFWMLPEENYNNQGWPVSGEIDIMEARGSSDLATSGALHYANTNGQHIYQTGTKSFSRRNGESNTDFHVYAIEWDEERIDWFVDDDLFFSVERRVWHPDGNRIYPDDDSAPFDRPFHILLNLAVGGNFDNGTMPPNDFESAELKVDYVRVYQWNYLLED